jgi:hypothetical protein
VRRSRRLHDEQQPRSADVLTARLIDHAGPLIEQVLCRGDTQPVDPQFGEETLGEADLMTSWLRHSKQPDVASRRKRWHSNAFQPMICGMHIELDFSNLPGDVAILLARQTHTRELADALGRVMSLDETDRDLIHQQIVGAVAKVVDDHLDEATKPQQ